MNSEPAMTDQESTINTYPADEIEQIELKDGLLVTLRPIRLQDAPGLQKTFLRLTPKTVYLRFLETFKTLSDKQARQFATVDYQDRMAFVAEITESSEDTIIGVARYAQVPNREPGLAEAAIVVMDEYQNRGLGTMMLIKLVKYARQHGIHAFLATVHVSNAQIMHFVRKSGLPAKKIMIEPGVWEIQVLLEGVLPGEVSDGSD